MPPCEVHGEHVYHAGELGLLVHNTNQDCNFVTEFRDEYGNIQYQIQQPKAVVPNNVLSGPISFGDNFAKKVRKHIDQVRNRGGVKDPIPSPGNGGIEEVERIIRERVAKGGGRATTFAGEAAIAFEDGGVTYIFRPNGEFWTILGN